MRRALNYLGTILAALGLVFVMVRLASEWTALRTTWGEADHSALLLALLAGTAAMTWVAVGWQLALHLSLPGHRVPPLFVTVRLYFVGEVAKYVPGSVWAAVGRSELLQRRGVGRPSAYGSVVLSLVALYVAGAAVAALSGLVLPEWASGRAAWVLPAALAIGAAALHHRVLAWAVELVERVAGQTLSVVIPPWRHSLLLVSSYLPAWFLIGGSTWLVSRSLGAEVPLLPLIFATTLSWLVGFLVVPAPGGLGAREAAFVVAASPFLGPLAPAVAILARLLFMTVDVVGAVAFSPLSLRPEEVDRP